MPRKGGGAPPPRRRKPPKKVAGPYRSQSSDPKIRAEATKREHRSVVPATPSSSVTGLVIRDVGKETELDLAGALRSLVSGATQPSALNPDGSGDLLSNYLRGSLENIGEVALRNTTDPSRSGAQGLTRLPDEKELRAAADILAVTPFGAAAKAGSGLAKASQAIRASQQTTRQAVRGAAARAEPAKVRAVRQGAKSRAGKAAEKVPRPVKTAGKVAGTAVTLPIKRPFTAPIAAQAPAAALSGDPREFGKAFTGEGTLAALGNVAGNAVASTLPGKVAQNVVKDAFTLPAIVLPSAYLPMAGVVEASQGDSSRLRKLWADYVEAGAIPAALRGDRAGVLKAIEDHPLFSALEISGTAAVVGRGAGAVARNTTGGRVGGTERPPVQIRGQGHLGNVNELMGRGRYSPDLIRQGIQRAYDSRRGDTIEPRGGVKGLLGLDPATRAMRHSARRFAYGQEAARRVNRSERLDLMNEARPRLGRFKTDKASANVVSQAVQRIVQRGDTFRDDLPAYRAALEAEHNSGRLTGPQKAANRKMVAQVDRAIHSGNPDEIVKAANTFIEAQSKIVSGLVERGLLNADQGVRAALFPWARVHLGAEYKPGVGLVDRQGNPLKTETIIASMRQQGVDPPGFLSQKPRTPGASAFFQSFFPERQSIPAQPRTGKATLEGTYDASYQALIEQLLFSGSKLDAAKSFDSMISEFGSPVPSTVRNMRDAWDALHDPERFGWDGPPPGLNMRPIRVAPFRATAEEMAKAQARQGLDSPLLDPNQAAASEALAARLLSEASKDGPGPYAYIAEPVFKEMEGLFKRTGTGEKAGQALGQLAKSAWLPFSPPFYIGNVVDNYLRMALAGIGPTDIILGRQAIKGRRGIPGLVDRDLAASESIIGGAGYGSVARQRIHRDSRQFEGTALQGFARSLEALGNTPGPKQAYQGFLKTRDLLLSINSKFSERLPQYGAVGKEMRRELQSKQGHWHHALMVSDRAFKDLLDGLRGTDKQIQYARAVEQVFSNWGKVGRAGRVLSSFAPFWQWARASTRLVMLTLPAHHPIKTGIIAAAAEMTEQERKQVGLDQFAEEPLPGFLQGTLPIGGGIARNVPKYTSFGVFGEYTEFISRLFLPQVQSPLQILRGIDWKGEKLAKEDGTPLGDLERAGLAILVAGEQFIPGLSLLESATGVSLPGNTGGSSGPAKFSPLATYEGDKLDFFRSLSNSRQINVPVGDSSSSSSGLSDFSQGYMDQLGGGGSSGSGLSDFSAGYLEELGR